jgi:RimJ/RimL family protein N-acetyltransferase
MLDCGLSSGQFVGELGFANFERQIDPPFGDAPEMGWVLSPEVHGMGFGSEALSKVVAWGDAFFKHDRALCIISPENAASQRIAEKNGFRKIAATTYTEEPVWMFERRFRC